MSLLKNKRVVFTVFISVLMLTIVAGSPYSANAQQKGDDVNKTLPHIQKKLDQLRERGVLSNKDSMDSAKVRSRVTSGVDYNSLNSDFTVFEHDQSSNRNPNPNPSHNFELYSQGQPVGNINGDSLNGNPVDDYIVTAIARDETTSELDDQTWKTAVFYGDNTSGTPDQIIRRKLVPAGDLNGDGYADAVAVETNLQYPSNTGQPVYIYEGSSNGFVQTGTTLFGGFSSDQKQISFQDFNRDGYQDVLTYYPDSSTDVIITWGASLFSDITFNTFTSILPNGPRRLAVEDVDGDTLKEIVSLNGSYGDGQIHVAEIDTTAQTNPTTGITVEQQFGFTSFTSQASDQHLHLIDIDGSGYHEIYISEGRKSPKHVVAYDTVSGTGYNTASIEFFNGSLVPFGDLNNDGRHDFIQGDSTNSYMPYISYGPADLTTNPSLDYQLTGNNSSNWQWEMGYNPYSGFGDLNGDGIDDALLAHNEAVSNEQMLGRRILQGSGSGAFNSVFHQYPGVNFYSRIASTKNVGDINEDGTEDFAMALTDQQKVEIYHSNNQTPDMTLDLTYSPTFIMQGDFNGDDVSDIGVMSRDFLTKTATRIEIFWGGASMDANADFTVNASDFQSADSPEIYGVHNIGDINEDGMDDFLTGSSFAHDSTTSPVTYLNEAYIFYGGSTISASPDITIQMGDGNGNYIWAGEKAVSLDDINGDGVGDFAVSAAGKMNADETYGQVQVFYGGSGNTYTNPDMILTPADYSISSFGWGLASGDFNGDSEFDIAVSGMNFSGSQEAGEAIGIQIYNGGPDFDNMADRFLNRPVVDLQNYSAISYYTNFEVNGALESLSDFNRDGKNELLFTSSNSSGSHATIYTFNTSSSGPTMVLKGANKATGLGGPYHAANGDFDGNGQVDIVMTQLLDNNDAFNSSRVYCYLLPDPINIASVEDVPEDQGEWIRISVDGYLMDAMSEDIYGFDSWSVRRMEVDSSWTSVATVKPYSDGSKFVDVRVPKTQPTDDNSVDHTYHFKVVAYDYTTDNVTRVLAETVVDSGKAFDNIAPGQVGNVAVTEQAAKTLSWSATDDNDVDSYLIHEIDANGQVANSAVGSTPHTATSFTLPDTFDGVRNFAVQTRDVNNNTGPVSQAVSALYPQVTGYNFNAGWNLIGLTVEADPDSIQAKLQNAAASGVFEYNGGYTEISNMEAGKGYWVKFSGDELQELQGLPFADLTVDLQQGWNLISGVGGALPVSMIQDADGIFLSRTVYAFDQMYASSDTLQPGTGYWVRASADGTVRLTHPKIQAANQNTAPKRNQLTKQDEEVEKQFGMVTISDGHNSRTLYFGSELPEQIDKRNYSLPPLPPGNVFDARFDDDMRLSEKEEVQISLNRAEDTALNISLNTQNLIDHKRYTVQEFRDGELLTEYTVQGDESVDIKYGETNSLLLSPAGNELDTENDMPEKFKLEQNYPNPFNPTTQIEYAVTEQASVTLEVFNILGRKVATLVNNEQQPGNYQVTFDGSNLASGVYLYRLQAGNKVSTKKFILAK